VGEIVNRREWNIEEESDEDTIQQLHIEDAHQEDGSLRSIADDEQDEEAQDSDVIDFYNEDELERALDEDAISVEEAAFSAGYLHALD
jgi:hypothetical protein